MDTNPYTSLALNAEANLDDQSEKTNETPDGLRGVEDTDAPVEMDAVSKHPDATMPVEDDNPDDPQTPDPLEDMEQLGEG